MVPAAQGANDDDQHLTFRARNSPSENSDLSPQLIKVEVSPTKGSAAEDEYNHGDQFSGSSIPASSDISTLHADGISHQSGDKVVASESANLNVSLQETVVVTPYLQVKVNVALCVFVELRDFRKLAIFDL